MHNYQREALYLSVLKASLPETNHPVISIHQLSTRIPTAPPSVTPLSAPCPIASARRTEPASPAASSPSKCPR